MDHEEARGLLMGMMPADNMVVSQEATIVTLRSRSSRISHPKAAEKAAEGDAKAAEKDSKAAA